MSERMEYGRQFEDESDEGTAETEGLERVDDIEERIYALSEFDKKTVEEILRVAKTNFSHSPAKWETLLDQVVKLLDNPDEDEDMFSGALQDKLVEANGLVIH